MMDQSEQQISERAAAGTAPDGQAAPAPAKKAPRVRRAASSPAGAPTKAPVTPPTDTATSAGAEALAAPAEAAAAEPATTDAVASDAVTTNAVTTDTGAEPPRRRATRSRKTAAAAEVPAETPVDAPAAAGTANESAEAQPAPKATRTRRRAATADAGPAAAPAAAETAVPADAGTDTAADAPVEPADAPAEKPARTRRTATRTRRTKADAEAPAGEAPADSTTAETAGNTATTTTAASDTAVANAAGADAAAATTATTDASSSDTASADEPAAKAAAPSYVDPFAIPESPLSLLFHAPDLSAAVPSVKVVEAPLDEDEDEDSDEGGRRRRRSRRSRGKARSDETADDAADDTDTDGDPAGGTDAEGTDGVTSRRRRRRRRGDQDIELAGGEDDDPPNTVTRVRAPRQSTEAPSDRVTSVKGSTRLEAKKQRRRESRDSGRRRQVITEAEFLARRESVDRQMVVRQRDDRIQIGVLEDGILAEHFVSKTQQDSLIGNVYLGKVQNVLPSMEAAFVDIGRGRNAVLYAGEVNWDAAGLDGQPRRIELALKSGDPVLVQVTKDPVGHKGARLTSQISLPGRYLVYVPGGSMTGISRKLPDVERNRLKRILKDRLPENAGVIVRTAAEGASEEELTHDINRLRAQWEEIERKSSSTKTLAPELLYGEPDLTIKVVRDVFNEDFSKLLVSGEEAWDTIEAYVMYVAPDLVGRLEKWTSDEDIFTASRIDEQIQKALDRKVYLPSGGSLVIDRTEAMTVVDVNTGKFTGSGGNLEETVTKNNLEAAEEVVRQLRLRDIGGIIVIDFIDMVLEANRDLVLRRLVECLGRDRTKHQVAEVTSLGLVQMTRKRMGTGLLEVFGEVCEHCAGRGVVTQDEPVEHRRHAVSTENHQQHLRQEKMSRSERKRSRGRTTEPSEEQQAAPEPRVDSPERAAKAEAARAALASIAAATHHAAEHPETAAAPAGQETVHVEVTEAVLTINGETVTLPRAEAAPAAVEPETPRLTLDSLTEAFNRKPAAGTSEPVPVTDPAGSATGSAAGREASGAGTPSRTATAAQEAPAVSQQARRRPRRRAAVSAQGSATSSSIETVAAAGTAEAQQAPQRHVARAGKPVQRIETGADEPMILGVGIPASEL